MFRSFFIILSLGALSFLLAPQFVQAATTEDILNQLAQRTIDNHVRPRYKLLNERVHDLSKQMTLLCSSPSAETLTDAKNDFRLTVKAFAGIEHIHFGPVIKKYRIERLAYWPDRKGRGRRAVAKLLRLKEASVLKASSLSQKSVAVQGLTALEYILYGKGAEQLEKSRFDDDGFRCRYGRTIAENLSNITQNVADGWAPGAPIVTALLNPAPTNNLYRNRSEVIQEFFQSMTASLKLLHEGKMIALLGRDAEHAKSKKAPFWRSKMTVEYLRTNLDAIDDLVRKSGFWELLPLKPIDMKRYVDGIFKQMYGSFDGFEKDGTRLTISEIVSGDTQRLEFKKLIKTISHANAGLSRNFAIAADLPMGFNAADGD